MACLPCEAAASNKDKEKLQDAIQRAKTHGKANNKEVVCIYKGVNGYCIMADDHPDIGTKTIIERVWCD